MSLETFRNVEKSFSVSRKLQKFCTTCRKTKYARLKIFVATWGYGLD